jgi:DNA-binding response OmpR family regulator
MKILLVEDEVNIASFISQGLSESGHEVRTACDGISGWELAQKESFQLLVLDLILPGMDGLELCTRYRAAYGYGPAVIMLTALGATGDIVKGLESGADDYLVKPFSFAELEARIQALLRRTKASAEALTCGDLVLETANRRAVRKGVSIDLTVREYRLLEYLMSHQGVALSRRDIILKVWDKEADRTMNIVDVYVNYLRAKIDKDFDTKLIHTVSGVGYRMGR